jgi:DUF4097 and DUF4098 domain-containing protein YvlB
MYKALLTAWIATVIATPLAAEEWAKTFKVSGPPELRVQTNDARIEVVSSQQNQISARVVTEGWRIADDEVRIMESQTGDHVGLDVQIPQVDWKMFHNLRRSVRIELSVPAKANLDLRTGDGAVSLASVEGTIQVRSGDGSIVAENLHGNVSLSSGDGRIEVSRTGGAVRVSTGDGSIHARDLEGEVELWSGDGGIDATGIQAALRAKTNDGRLNVDGRFNRLELRSGDGSVTATVREGSRMEGDWSLSSNDGSITLRLPETFPAELDARTGDGEVSLDIPVQVSGSLSRSRIQGTIQQGGQRLELRTGDGAIHLEKL